jgi:hypothetical protein
MKQCREAVSTKFYRVESKRLGSQLHRAWLYDIRGMGTGNVQPSSLPIAGFGAPPTGTIDGVEVISYLVPPSYTLSP